MIRVRKNIHMVQIIFNKNFQLFQKWLYTFIHLQVTFDEKIFDQTSIMKYLTFF